MSFKKNFSYSAGKYLVTRNFCFNKQHVQFPSIVQSYDIRHQRIRIKIENFGASIVGLFCVCKVFLEAAIKKRSEIFDKYVRRFRIVGELTLGGEQFL